MIILLPVRRYPVGIELDDAGADARVWAPGRNRVAVVHGASAERTTTTALAAQADGYFAGVIRGLRAGDRYGFRLDDDAKILSRPRVALAARRARTVRRRSSTRGLRLDGRRLARRRRVHGQVIYELHVGTFTARGHVRGGARASCRALRELGVTVIEMMPVAEFPGAFGWGYDGVDLCAPTRLYGTPDDLRRVRRPRPRAGPRRHPRRRLQPPRPRRQLPEGVRAATTSRDRTATSGARR